MTRNRSALSRLQQLARDKRPRSLAHKVLVRRDESGWGAFVALIATLPVLFLLGVTVFAA